MDPITRGRPRFPSSSQPSTHRARGDDVGQHLSGPNRRKLVDIAHDQQRRFVGDRRQQQHPHEQNVDHEQVAVERVLAVAPEPAGSGIDLEQAVDGLRLEPGGLTHPLRRPPSRRAQQNVHALGRQDAQDRVDNRRTIPISEKSYRVF